MFNDEPIFLDNENEDSGHSEQNNTDKGKEEKPQCRFGDVDNADLEKPDVKKWVYSQILSDQISLNQSVSQKNKIRKGKIPMTDRLMNRAIQ